MIIDHYINKVCTQILYGELNLEVKGKKYYFQGQNEGPNVHLTVHKLSMLWDLYFRGSVGLGDAYIKGKLITKGDFSVFKSTKMPTKF